MLFELQKLVCYGMTWGVIMKILEQVLMPCLSIQHAALRKMMRKGHEQTCLV